MFILVELKKKILVLSPLVCRIDSSGKAKAHTTYSIAPFNIDGFFITLIEKFIFIDISSFIIR
jgi:hypothetical protein